MPHVSKNRLRKGDEEKLLESLKVVLSKIDKTEDVDSFLYSLLSDTEQLMIAKRLAIIVMLKEGLPESTVAHALHVTRETVSRLKMKSELKEAGYNLALKVLEQQKQLETFKQFLISLAKYSIRATGGYLKPTILD